MRRAKAYYRSAIVTFGNLFHFLIRFSGHFCCFLAILTEILYTLKILFKSHKEAKSED